MNMKSKVILTSFLFGVLNLAVFGQSEKFTSLEELNSLSAKYFQINNLDSAINVIEYARNKYPEYDKDATYLLDSLFLITKQDSNVLKNIDYGLKKRYFFGLERWEYSDFINNPEFKRLARIDWQIEDSLNKISHMKYEVVLPKNYSIDKNYPLLFVFHGNSRNIQKEKDVWTSNIIRDRYIVIFVQSYIHLTPNDYRWGENDEKTDREFKEIYEQIVKKYSTAKNKIIFSAMSMGGYIAISYAFNQFVPVNGLVLNCPVVPDLADSLIRKFVAENKKIAIITGENDFLLNNQKDLIYKVNKMGGNNSMMINTGLGHEYSENFSTLLDKYLNWILE
jgi:hypothetical protein